MKKRILAAVAALAIAALASGCAGLQLFSSHHEHYHGDEAVEKRVEVLEQRVGELEAPSQ